MLIAQQDTAIAAYHERVPVFRIPQARRVENFVRMMGDEGATIGEIAAALEMDKCAVSGRQHELRKGKRLMFRSERRCAVSGVTCKPLVVYRAGQEALF